MKNNKIKLRFPVFDISSWLTTLVAAIIVILLWIFAPKSLLTAVIFFAVVYIGFNLPRWFGRKIRNERTILAKQKEQEKWGFYSRDREGPWINYIDFPLVKMTDYARGKYFYSEWLIIHDGMIIVNPGISKVDKDKSKVFYDYSIKRAYAWDGCTPKRYFYWFAIFGTPDWWMQEEEVLTIVDGQIEAWDIFWARAHHASLVHDALYQYIENIPIPKDQVDSLFFEMLCESGFSEWLAKTYKFAVKTFGAKDVDEKNVSDNSSLVVQYIPQINEEQD